MLNHVQNFITTTLCRRKILLKYFEEELTDGTSNKSNCCDNCTTMLNAPSTSEYLPKDFTQEVIKFLSVMKLSSSDYGAGLYIGYLIGSVSNLS